MNIRRYNLRIWTKCVKRTFRLEISVHHSIAVYILQSFHYLCCVEQSGCWPAREISAFVSIMPTVEHSLYILEQITSCCVFHADVQVFYVVKREHQPMSDVAKSVRFYETYLADLSDWNYQFQGANGGPKFNSSCSVNKTKNCSRRSRSPHDRRLS